MFPITRPNTPRTQLHDTIVNSNQRDILKNIRSDFNTITFSQLENAQEKYPDIRGKVESLVDKYNPDTLAQGFLYDIAGENIPLAIHRGHEINDGEPLSNFSEEQLGAIIRQVHPVTQDPDAYHELLNFQKNNLEVFTIEGLTGDESILNGKEGVRAKEFIPANTLIDIQGGMRIRKTDILTRRNLNTLYQFIDQSSNKYFTGIGKNALDLRSIVMKANSAFASPEKENLSLITFPYKTGNDESTPIIAMYANRDIEADEELRFSYDYINPALMED